MAEKRTEVTEEVQERLEVLELDRTPRAEKLAREAQLLEGASEVRYAERAFRPRHAASIDEIRSAVDAMPAARAAIELPPVPAPPPPAPTLRPPPRADLMRLLEPAVQGEVVAVESVYRTESGEVVEATIAQDGERRVATFLVEGDKVHPMSDVESRIDALPRPQAPAAAIRSSPPPAATPPAPPTDAPKKRFGLPSLGKRKDAAAQTPAAPSEPAADEKPAPSRKRFGFGKK